MNGGLRDFLNGLPLFRWSVLLVRSLTSRSRKDVFTDYYQNGKWFDSESVSGPGSTLAYTENLRRKLPRLWEKYRISSFLDAPCGDFNWFQHIERPEGFVYSGADIVESLVSENGRRWGDKCTRFSILDICKDVLPQAEMWMCRDCWFHLSYREIRLAIRNFERSQIPYLLTSSHHLCRENKDIVTGGFRLLNLERPPFSFPEPIDFIDDWIDGYPPRRLLLWRREQVLEGI